MAQTGRRSTSGGQGDSRLLRASEGRALESRNGLRECYCGAMSAVSPLWRWYKSRRVAWLTIDLVLRSFLGVCAGAQSRLEVYRRISTLCMLRASPRQVSRRGGREGMVIGKGLMTVEVGASEPAVEDSGPSTQRRGSSSRQSRSQSRTPAIPSTFPEESDGVEGEQGDFEVPSAQVPDPAQNESSSRSASAMVVEPPSAQPEPPAPAQAESSASRPASRRVRALFSTSLTAAADISHFARE